jgi:hypothetical protein
VSAFLSKLWLEHVDGVNWIVLAPLVYQSDLLKKMVPDGIVVFPAGKGTDLASVPREAQGIVPASGPYNPASVMHDGGYFGYLQTKDGQPVRLTKSQSDRLFLEAMLASGVDPPLAKIMYQLVKAFGQKPQVP